MTPLRAKTMDGYIRVSRKAGRDGATYMSPDLQREAIERWASYKGVTILEWHVDEDWSGGAASRPGLDRARERCLGRETGGIVSWKIDRFSRNTVQGLTDLKSLQEVGARLAFTAEDIDTGGMGKYVYTLMLANAELFLDNITENWRRVQARALERGAYVGSTPFGYERVTDPRSERVGCLVPDPQWGPVVTEAFRVAAQDGMHGAMAYLESAAPDKRWRTVETRRLLRRRVYLGEVSIGSVERATLDVRRGAHEALTTPAIFEAAQTEPRTRRSNGDYPLSGIAVCARCGSGLTGQLQTHTRTGYTYRRYRCSNPACGGGSSISADKLESHVREILRDLLSDLQFVLSAVSPEGLAEAQSDLETAEEERRRYAEDLEIREILGDQDWRSGALARSRAVDEAQARFRALAGQSVEAMILPGADQMDDPEMFDRALRVAVAAVTVKRGRGSVEDRVAVSWRDGYEASGELAA